MKHRIRLVTNDFYVVTLEHVSELTNGKWPWTGVSVYCICSQYVEQTLLLFATKMVVK